MQKNSEVYLNKLFTKAKLWFGSKRFSVYLFCIGISTFIWFLMKFSGSFTTQLPVKVHFTTPSTKWYVKNENLALTIDARGFGFGLMWYKISGLRDINIDLSQFEIRGEELDHFIIVPNDFVLNSLSKLFSEEEYIDAIYPSVIKVDLSHALTKSVPIVSKVKVYTENGYKIKNKIQIKPAKLELSGPEYILSDIDHVDSFVDTIRALKEDITMKLLLDVDSLNEWIVGKKDVDLNIQVMELTSGTIEIPVVARVEDPLTSVKILPTKVKLFYQVGLADYQLVDEKTFKAYVSLSAGNDLPDKLKVLISNIPEFVEIIRIEPPYVEYLISKKTEQ